MHPLSKVIECEDAYSCLCSCFPLQNEARKLNHQEVVEEDKRLKLPSNWEAKKARLEWEMTEDQKKKVIQYLSMAYINSIVLIM